MAGSSGFLCLPETIVWPASGVGAHSKFSDILGGLTAFLKNLKKMSGCATSRHGDDSSGADFDPAERFPQDSQVPMFEHLGLRPADKDHQVFESGHLITARQEVMGAVLDWLDKYMGPVARR